MTSKVPDTALDYTVVITPVHNLRPVGKSVKFAGGILNDSQMTWTMNELLRQQRAYLFCHETLLVNTTSFACLFYRAPQQNKKYAITVIDKVKEATVARRYSDWRRAVERQKVVKRQERKRQERLLETSAGWRKAKKNKKRKKTQVQECSWECNANAWSW